VTLAIAKAVDRRNLPKPTSDLDRARADIARFGYCLLADAVPEPLLGRLRARTQTQADAEKRLDQAFEDGGANQQWGAFRDAQGRIRADAFKARNGGINQRVWMLANKGRVYHEVLELDPILSLVGDVLGEAFQLSAYNANIARHGSVPMNLHTDQWWAPTPHRPDRKPLAIGSINRTTFDREAGLEPMDIPAMIAPAACAQVIVMLNDFTDANGGTRIVPGSHLWGRHPDPVLDADVETIAAEGPAGTAVITDGRVWHGTGANTTNDDRWALLVTFCGPQFRPQENYTVGLSDEMYDAASERVRALLGFGVWWAYGRTGDPTVEQIGREPALGELS
jgi:ectoine hydroxylase-related dioxygenase (phytanoyl-CoA dioxygenase family)